MSANLEETSAPHDPVVLTDDDFRRVATLMRERCGIEIREGKEMLVRSRLTPRAAQLGLRTIGQYLELVARDGRELSMLVDLLTTNKTGFFREPPHFEYLERTILPAVERDRPFRVWSAGCASGEEPYSVAISWLESAPHGAPEPAILATDLSTRALAVARGARYPRAALDELPADRVRRHFDDGDGGPAQVAIREAARRHVTFARLNLMDDWPMRGPFDLILCRNVMIYFSRPTQRKLAERFARLLRVGGHLFVGHAESLSGSTAELEFVQPAIYRRVPGSGARADVMTGDDRR